MARRRGLADIRASAMAAVSSRKRSQHGCYLELAAISLHRTRLEKLRQASRALGEEVDRRLELLEVQAALLRRHAADHGASEAASMPETHAGEIAAPRRSVCRQEPGETRSAADPADEDDFTAHEFTY